MPATTSSSEIRCALLTSTLHYQMLMDGEIGITAAPSLIDEIENLGIPILIFLRPFQIRPKTNLYLYSTNTFVLKSVLLQGPLILYRAIFSKHKGLSLSQDMKFHLEAFLWKLIFTKYSITHVFGIAMTPAVIHATRSLGIRAFDIQHGVFGSEYDTLEDYWSIEKSRRLVPDVFLAWDDHYKEMAIDQGVPSITIPTIFTFNPPNQPNVTKSRFLVTLGWGDSLSVDPFGAVSNSLMNVLVGLPGEYLTFRIHPQHSLSPNLSNLENWLSINFPGCKVTQPNMKSLFDDLTNSRVHISSRSAVAYHAALVGVPTFFSEDLPVEFFPNEMWRSGLLRKIKSPENDIQNYDATANHFTYFGIRVTKPSTLNDLFEI